MHARPYPKRTAPGRSRPAARCHQGSAAAAAAFAAVAGPVTDPTNRAGVALLWLHLIEDRVLSAGGRGGPSECAR
jgi:hypothetical protein